MGLFDILNNPIVRETIATMATQAGGNLKNLGQKTGGSGGLLGAGALGALVGSMLPKGGMKAAGVLGVGALAWNFYKTWAEQKAAGKGGLFGDGAQSGDAFFAYSGPETGAQAAQDPTAMLLLRAMVYAARADGHIDAAEEDRITKLLQQFFPDQDVQPVLQRLVQETIDPAALAQGVQSAEQAEDLYRLSCIIMDIDHFMERSYLTQLGTCLRLTPERMQELEREADEVRARLAEM